MRSHASAISQIERDSSAAVRSGGARAPGPQRGRATAGRFYCVFELGARRYALDAAFVGEVVAVTQLVRVPLTPSWYLGLFNLRGTPLSVVDLDAVLRLSAGARAVPDGTLNALVFRGEELSVGLHIDKIDAVYAVDRATFEASAARDEHPAVAGVLTFHERGNTVATLLDHRQVAAALESLRSNQPTVATRTSLPERDDQI